MIAIKLSKLSSSIVIGVIVLFWFMNYHMAKHCILAEFFGKHEFFDITNRITIYITHIVFIYLNGWLLYNIWYDKTFYINEIKNTDVFYLHIYITLSILFISFF
jgi:hypothetical protein